jgi:hypothetical protein
MLFAVSFRFSNKNYADHTSKMGQNTYFSLRKIDSQTKNCLRLLNKMIRRNKVKIKLREKIDK